MSGVAQRRKTRPNESDGRKGKDGWTSVSKVTQERRGIKGAGQRRREKKWIKRRNRERTGVGERGREILPGVTNALPRGGEVSSMFMPWFTGLPIVPNGPRPRCLPHRPLSLALPPWKSPRQRYPLSSLPSPFFPLSIYIFCSLAGKIVTLIGNAIGLAYPWRPKP